MAFGCHAIDTAGHGFQLLIGHVVTADAGIIPIGHQDRTRRVPNARAASEGRNQLSGPVSRSTV